MPAFDQVKTPSQLKGFVNNGKSTYFFKRSTMRFFGDTMSNYGIKRHSISGQTVIELKRKKPVKHGLHESAYFMLEDGRIDAAKRISSGEFMKMSITNQ